MKNKKNELKILVLALVGVIGFGWIAYMVFCKQDFFVDEILMPLSLLFSIYLAAAIAGIVIWFFVKEKILEPRGLWPMGQLSK